MGTCVHVCVQVPRYVFRDRRSASRLVLAFRLAQQCLHRLGDPRVCPALVVSAALAPVGSQECNLAWVLRTQTQLLTLHGKRFPPESALQACLLLCLSVCSFLRSSTTQKQIKILFDDYFVFKQISFPFFYLFFFLDFFYLIHMSILFIRVSVCYSVMWCAGT